MRSVLPPGGVIALEVKARQSIRIVDLHGQQVSDFISFNGSNRKERLAMYPSRAINRTWKLTKGHTLYSNLCRPLWTIEEDTVGENYSGGGFCNRYINEARYGRKDTPNCLDNFVAALEPYGLGESDIDFDMCFNVFMTITYEPDGRWEIREPKSKAGDYIQLRAEMGQIVAISNCPQLLNPCNAFSLKPVEVLLLATDND